METLGGGPVDEYQDKHYAEDSGITRRNKPRIITIAAAISLLGVVLLAGFGLGVNNADSFIGSNKTAANLLSQKTSLQLSTSAAVSNPNNQNSITGIVEEMGAAVVAIETESYQTAWSRGNQFDGRWFAPVNPRQQTVEGLGSGFIISSNGYLLTNYHVVEGTDSIKVRLYGSEESYNAEIVGSDAEQDLAVLKIDAGQELPIMTLGNSDSTSAGDWAIAIGNPYGLDHTVTVGVISAKERPMTIEGQTYTSLLQTDASINPGNSGGPLLNINGEVIGINTAVNTEGQGLGFAIPINTASSFLQDLVSKGKIATLE